MPTFQFRLKRVLDWYQTQVQLEQGRLALCLATLGEVRKSIVRLRTESLTIERGVISNKSIAAPDLAALGLYRLQTRIQVSELEQELVRCDRAAKHQMSVVQSAQRRLRLVEKLRDRRLSEHLRAEDKATESLAAEVYLSKWNAAARAAHTAELSKKAICGIHS